MELTQYCIFECCLWFTCAICSKVSESYSSRKMGILALFWAMERNFTFTQSQDMGSDIFKLFDLMSEYLFNEYRCHDCETGNGIRAMDYPIICLSSFDLVKWWDQCVRDYDLLKQFSIATHENTTHSISDQITWTITYSGAICCTDSISSLKIMASVLIEEIFTHQVKKFKNVRAHILGLGKGKIAFHGSKKS